MTVDSEVSPGKRPLHWFLALRSAVGTPLLLRLAVV